MHTQTSVMNEAELLSRVRGEYLEMPGLVLTVEQAGRLWGVDAPTSRRLLDALVEGEFLRRAGGRYLRSDTRRRRN
jgi:Fic family protein